MISRRRLHTGAMAAGLGISLAAALILPFMPEPSAAQGWTPGKFDPLTGDLPHSVVCLDLTGAPVSCGGSGSTGSVSTGADGQAPTATNQGVAGYNFLFNGTGWDRWRGTIAGGALVQPGAGALFPVQGSTAVNAAGAENPVRMGCDANSTSTVTVTQGRQSLQCSPQGALLPPVVMTSAGYVITKTAVSAASVQVCPAVSPASAATYTSEELEASVAGGLSFTGAALTTATYGTGTGSPDFVFAASNGYYLDPAPSVLARTFYATGAGTAICIQRFAK